MTEFPAHKRYRLSVKGKATQCRANRKHRYGGFTDADYDRLLQEQAGHCALCPQTPATSKRGRLSVDHDHKTNKVRGLLCQRCNAALGKLGDNEEGLARALAYVRGCL